MNTRLNWSGWLLRVLTCDGVLPVVLLATSVTLSRLSLGQGELYLILSAGIPVSAFMVRFFMGQRAIEHNHCSALTRRFQLIVLVLGLIVIALMDCLLIVLSMLPPPNGNKAEKYLILFLGFAIAYLAYLACMTFAMYPGREPIPLGEVGYDAPDLDEE